MIVERNSRIIANLRNNSEISLIICKKSFSENLLLMKNHDKSLLSFLFNLEKGNVKESDFCIQFPRFQHSEIVTCGM